MYTLTLQLPELKAVSITTGDDAIRYYLNGVLVTSHNGKAALVSTDGHRLTAYRSDEDYNGPDFIVPNGLLAQVKKPMFGNTVVVTFDGETAGRITIKHAGGESSDKAIDGRFPDWQRVIPREPSGEHKADIGYDAAYLGDYAKMHRALGNRMTGINIVPNGSGATIIDIGRDDFICVLMPMRSTPWGLPGWLDKPEEPAAEAPATEAEEQEEAA